MKIPDSYYGFVFKTIFPNGKISINQTTFRFESKYFLRYFGSGVKVSFAVRKFGRQNLKKQILIFCDSKEQLDAWEKIYIKKFNSRNPEIGYNIHPGGGSKGKWDERSKEKLRKSKMGNKNAIGNTNRKGAVLSEETKNKLRKKHSREWADKLIGNKNGIGNKSKLGQHNSKISEKKRLKKLAETIFMRKLFMGLFNNDSTLY